MSLQEQLTQLEEQKIQADNELEFSQRELNEILQQAKQISKERQQLQKYCFLSYSIPIYFSVLLINVTMPYCLSGRKKLHKNKILLKQKMI